AVRPEDKPKADRRDDRKPEKPEAKDRPDKAEARADRTDAKDRPDKAEARADEAESKDKTEKAETKAESKVRYTLQLSSFQDKAEAEAFLNATKGAGYQAYLIEADVSGKGTFYRVRLGSYRSQDAANDAKAEYEKSAKKTAQIMRL